MKSELENSLKNKMIYPDAISYVRKYINKFNYPDNKKLAGNFKTTKCSPLKLKVKNSGSVSIEPSVNSFNRKNSDSKKEIKLASKEELNLTCNLCDTNYQLQRKKNKSQGIVSYNNSNMINNVNNINNFSNILINTNYSNNINNNNINNNNSNNNNIINNNIISNNNNTTSKNNSLSKNKKTNKKNINLKVFSANTNNIKRKNDIQINNINNLHQNNNFNRNSNNGYNNNTNNNNNNYYNEINKNFYKNINCNNHKNGNNYSNNFNSSNSSNKQIINSKNNEGLIVNLITNERINLKTSKFQITKEISRLFKNLKNTQKDVKIKTYFNSNGHSLDNKNNNKNSNKTNGNDNNDINKNDNDNKDNNYNNKESNIDNNFNINNNINNINVNNDKNNTREKNSAKNKEKLMNLYSSLLISNINYPNQRKQSQVLVKNQNTNNSNKINSIKTCFIGQSVSSKLKKNTKEDQKKVPVTIKESMTTPITVQNSRKGSSEKDSKNKMTRINISKKQIKKNSILMSGMKNIQFFKDNTKDYTHPLNINNNLQNNKPIINNRSSNKKKNKFNVFGIRNFRKKNLINNLSYKQHFTTTNTPKKNNPNLLKSQTQFKVEDIISNSSNNNNFNSNNFNSNNFNSNNFNSNNFNSNNIILNNDNYLNNYKLELREINNRKNNKITNHNLLIKALLTNDLINNNKNISNNINTNKFNYLTKIKSNNNTNNNDKKYIQNNIGLHTNIHLNYPKIKEKTTTNSKQIIKSNNHYKSIFSIDKNGLLVDDLHFERSRALSKWESKQNSVLESKKLSKKTSESILNNKNSDKNQNEINKNIKINVVNIRNNHNKNIILQNNSKILFPNYSMISTNTKDKNNINNNTLTICTSKQPKLSNELSGISLAMIRIEKSNKDACINSLKVNKTEGNIIKNSRCLLKKEIKKNQISNKNTNINKNDRSKNENDLDNNSNDNSYHIRNKNNKRNKNKFKSINKAKNKNITLNLETNIKILENNKFNKFKNNFKYNNCNNNNIHNISEITKINNFFIESANKYENNNDLLINNIKNNEKHFTLHFKNSNSLKLLTKNTKLITNTNSLRSSIKEDNSMKNENEKELIEVNDNIDNDNINKNNKINNNLNQFENNNNISKVSSNIGNNNSNENNNKDYKLERLKNDTKNYKLKNINQENIDILEVKDQLHLSANYQTKNNKNIKSAPISTSTKIAKSTCPLEFQSLEHAIDNEEKLKLLKEGLLYSKESIRLSDYIKKYYKTFFEYPKTQLSFYKIGRIIGKGAFGKVNLALHVLTGKIVAIKSFNKQKQNLSNKKEYSFSKISKEIQLMKSLRNNCVVKILDKIETENYLMIVMENVSGGDLLTFVKKRTKLKENMAKQIFKQLLLALKYIHSKGIIHRDIKLDNILIDLNNNIKLCDFGVGQMIHEGQILKEQCGTPAYIAPEILQNENGYEGPPVDVWSSGVVLYAMLNGTVPFKAVNLKDLHQIIINGIFQEVKGLSDEANDLIYKLLETNPSKRITVDEALQHPWLTNCKFDNFKSMNNNNCEDYFNNNKMTLFTKAELILLSKMNVDYRNCSKEQMIENFTLKNLYTKNFSENKNNRSKSIIFAPFNSSKSEEDNSFIFNNKNYNNSNNNGMVMVEEQGLLLQNNAIQFDDNAKVLNRQYELNNNGEIDHGILINHSHFSNNTDNNDNDNDNNNNNSLNNNSKDDIKDNNKLDKCCGLKVIDKKLTDKNPKIIFNSENENEINYNEIKEDGKILHKEISKNKQDKINGSQRNQSNGTSLLTNSSTVALDETVLKNMENLGYKKDYIQKCLNGNEINYCTATYYLLLNWLDISELKND